VRFYYRPYRSRWGVSFGAGWGLLLAISLLPLLLLLWFVEGMWALLGLVFPRESQWPLRVLALVGVLGLLAALGSSVHLSPREAAGVSQSDEVRWALAAWTRDDPHCKTTVPLLYTDTVTIKPCTPPGMRSGYYGGVLVNDPNCQSDGINGTDPNTDGDVSCTSPAGVSGNNQTAGTPIRAKGQTLWYANDPHCDASDNADKVTVEPCTPVGMPAGYIRGELVHDPGCVGVPGSYEDGNTSIRCTPVPGSGS
jgi:hypothetical protein